MAISTEAWAMAMLEDMAASTDWAMAMAMEAMGLALAWKVLI